MTLYYFGVLIMYCNNSLDFKILVINYDSFIYLLVFL